MPKPISRASREAEKILLDPLTRELVLPRHRGSTQDIGFDRGSRSCSPYPQWNQPSRATRIEAISWFQKSGSDGFPGDSRSPRSLRN